MTNEVKEAINTLKILKDYYNDKDEDGYIGFDDKDNEAIDFAIKALEQGDILGKIRAEIVKMNEIALKTLMPFDGLEKVTYTTGFVDGLGSTLDVIDKYRK